jgi:phytoene/squalene synthetase
MYLLGYIPAHNRVYVADKDMGIFSFSLSLTLVEYQTAILRGDYDTANELLPTIPNDQRNKIARFLEAQGKFNSRVISNSYAVTDRDLRQISRRWLCRSRRILISGSISLSS